MLVSHFTIRWTELCQFPFRSIFREVLQFPVIYLFSTQQNMIGLKKQVFLQAGSIIGSTQDTNAFIINDLRIPRFQVFHFISKCYNRQLQKTWTLKKHGTNDENANDIHTYFTCLLYDRQFLK